MIDKEKLIKELHDAEEKDAFKELPSWVLNVIEKQPEVKNEKATPKEPNLYSDYDTKKVFWECPNCLSPLCDENECDGHGGYCEHCGQAIDWSDEE